MTVTMRRLPLSDEDIDLLCEALDSHVYWQLADAKYRDSGNVLTPGSDEDEHRADILRAERLIVMFEGMRPSDLDASAPLDHPATHGQHVESVATAAALVEQQGTAPKESDHGE